MFITDTFVSKEDYQFFLFFWQYDFWIARKLFFLLNSKLQSVDLKK